HSGLLHTRCGNVRLSTRHADDINALPDVLVEGVSLLPELLKESRAMNTSEAYRRGFKRWFIQDRQVSGWSMGAFS
ncbi:hypothetical protein DPMN_186578, partial [Dreissena polymorpha]